MSLFLRKKKNTVLFISFFIKMKKHPTTTNKEIDNILREGTYEGSGVYSPTEKYPNGLTTSNVLVIKKMNSSKYHYENKLTACDSKTKQMKYKGIRKGDFILGTGTHKRETDTSC